jgi:hypothetical protein
VVKGAQNMIKIRVSYTDPEDKKRVLELLKGLSIIKVYKDQVKGKHTTTYIDAE